MNKELILKVADAIENDSIKGLKFNMNYFGIKMECGTVACIAGYTYALHNNTLPGDAYYDDIRFGAQEALGLTRIEANKLFYAEGSRYEDALDELPAHVAVATLRRLAESGEVVWLEEEEE